MRTLSNPYKYWVLFIFQNEITIKELVKMDKREYEAIGLRIRTVQRSLGLLVNVIRLLVLESIPDVPANLLGILAIVLMLVGIMQTDFRKKN